jgi:two-component system, chemotaxis family, chemotaxis protein CheY
MAHILLIDDEITLRDMMRRLLVNDGHSVVEAENGKTALAHLARESFDIVITDILMPEMDGVEVIQAVRRLAPQVRIIAMSGGGRNSAEFYLALAAKVGAHRALGKPFSPEEVLTMVRELADKKP